MKWLQRLFGKDASDSKDWEMKIYQAETEAGNTYYHVRFYYPQLSDWLWLTSSGNITQYTDKARRFDNLEEARSVGRAEIDQLKEWEMNRQLRSLKVVE